MVVTRIFFLFSKLRQTLLATACVCAEMHIPPLSPTRAASEGFKIPCRWFHKRNPGESHEHANNMEGNTRVILRNGQSQFHSCTIIKNKQNLKIPLYPVYFPNITAGSALFRVGENEKQPRCPLRGADSVSGGVPHVGPHEVA